MKKFVSVLLVTGLAATWVGCGAATDSEVTEVGESSEPGVTLVTLKVPNMF
jgi:hypothetical protein